MVNVLLKEKKDLARDDALDVAKGLCILLMVAGHMNGIGQDLHKAIYSFHMPLFFAFAGFTAKYPPALGLAIRLKFKRLVLPAFAFGVICSLPFVLRLIKGRLQSEDFLLMAWGTFLGYPSADSTFQSTPLWFLFALFYCYSLFYIVGKDERLVLAVSFGAWIATISGVFYDFPVQFKYVMSGFSFFGFAYTFRCYAVSPGLIRWRWWFGLLAGLLWVGLVRFSPHVAMDQGYLGEWSSGLVVMVVALSGIFLVYGFSNFFVGVFPFSYLSFISKNSFAFVGLNYFVDQRLSPILNGWYLFALDVLVLSVIAYFLTKAGWFGRLLNGRI